MNETFTNRLKHSDNVAIINVKTALTHSLFTCTGVTRYWWSRNRHLVTPKFAQHIVQGSLESNKTRCHKFKARDTSLKERPLNSQQCRNSKQIVFKDVHACICRWMRSGDNAGIWTINKGAYVVKTDFL